MNCLLPGETAVICYRSQSSDSTTLSIGGAQLVMDRLLVPTLPLLKSRRNAASIVKRFLRAHRVEVFLSEFLDASLNWLDVAKELKIRYFAHAHGYDVSMLLRDPKWQNAYRRYNEADGVVTVSEYSRKRLISLGIEATKVHVIPCGVDITVEPKNHQHGKDAVRCLAVGRMVSKKAPILSLDAFRRASLEYPNLRLDYVGEGELLPAARQFVHAFALQDRVVLHGGQSSEVVEDLMQEADIFIQHSMTDPDTGDQEGLPVAILEAMAHSLPVVSTVHAGIPEAVVQGENGLLVEEGDTIGMARNIVTLARDEQLRQELGSSGWFRARKHFAWSREREALLELFGF